MTDRFRVLHALRVKGFGDPTAIAESTGLPVPQVVLLLTAARDEELVRERAGRLPGWVLTPEGRGVHADLLAGAGAADGDLVALESAYVFFEPVNAEFKDTCAAWQLRPSESGPVPNDHTDAAYDAGIRTRATAVHASVVPIAAAIGNAVSRLAGYTPRLASAMARFTSGDDRALAAPLAGSYHDVWMELHQDLLLTLGRTRGESDA